MNDLLKTISCNEQMQAATREFYEGMTLDGLNLKLSEAHAKMKLLAGLGMADVLFYSLAATKLMELIERKEREAAGLPAQQ